MTWATQRTDAGAPPHQPPAAPQGKPPGVVIATIMRARGGTGLQTYVDSLARYLREAERPVSVVSPFSYPLPAVAPVFAVRRMIDPLAPAASVWWYRYWHYVFLRLALRRQLAEWARTGRPVVVYAQCPLSAKAALEARTTTGQRVVMAVHYNGSQADEWVGRGKIAVDGALYRSIKLLERTVIPQLDGVVYPSRFVQRQVEAATANAVQARSVRLPNFTGEPPPRQMAFTRDLVNVGTLEARKNQAYLLRVLAAAKQDFGCVMTLSLIGDGPDRGQLERLAQDLGVREQVAFMGFQPDCARLLANHRVYVHSALLDNLPISLLEALACGLPIVAGAVGGVPEIYEDGVEGFFWPLDDPQAGARRLVPLIRDEALHRRCAEAAKRRFRERYKTDAVAARLLEFLDTA